MTDPTDPWAVAEPPKIDGQRVFSRDTHIWFYRQPGGCLEIGQEMEYGPDSTIHICAVGDDQDAFIAELTAFHAEVKGSTDLDPGTEGDHNAG